MPKNNIQKANTNDTKRSTGVMMEENSEKTEPDVLSTEQQEYRSFILQRLDRARQNREQSHREFDGMSYMADYQFNLDAANTYLTPKRNDDEVRVNTATSEKKLEAMMNEILSMNIQQEVRAHDKDDLEIAQLGRDFSDITTRTNIMEKEEDKWEGFVRELISQRAVFIEEKFIEKTVIKNGKPFTTRKAEKRLIPGRKVYLGDINLAASRFNEQPYISIYDRISYPEARTILSKYDNWKFVSNQAGGQNNSFGMNEDGYYTWRLHDLGEGEVEIIRYYSYPDGEWQIIANGIPLLPPKTKLPWNYEGYNITMTVNKPIRADFAYGKPPIASAKTIQALENETIRNLIRKFRQALEPPMATQSKTIFSRDIWTAGAVTQGLTKGTHEKLIDHSGVTNSEMAMYTLINGITEEFIGVSRITQGLSSQGTKTATETLEQLNQSIKMMGLTVLAVMRMRRDMTYLRIYNVLENFTKPVGKKLQEETGKIINKFQQFTLDGADIGSGKKGRRVIRFMDRDITNDETDAMFNLEEKLEKQGKSVRFSTINTKKLNSIPIFWYVIPVQKERAGSAVDKLMQREKTTQALEVETASQGKIKVNWNKVAQSLENIWEDKDMFEETPPDQIQPIVNPEQEQVKGEAQDLLKKIQSQGGSGIGGQLTESVQRQVRQPETNDVISRA